MILEYLNRNRAQCNTAKVCDRDRTDWETRETGCVSLRQRVEAALCPCRKKADLHKETLTWGRRRRWNGGSGIWTGGTSLLSSADEYRLSVSLSLKSAVATILLLLYSFAVSGGWPRGVTSCRRRVCLVRVNRMYLVVEAIEEAMMKMLPYFVKNAVLTQSEINRM